MFIVLQTIWREKLTYLKQLSQKASYLLLVTFLMKNTKEDCLFLQSERRYKRGGRQKLQVIDSPAGKFPNIHKNTNVWEISPNIKVTHPYQTPSSYPAWEWPVHSLWELYTIAPNFQSNSGGCLRQNHKIHQLGLNNLQSRNWAYFSPDWLISTFENTNLS